MDYICLAVSRDTSSNSFKHTHTKHLNHEDFVRLINYFKLKERKNLSPLFYEETKKEVTSATEMLPF